MTSPHGDPLVTRRQAAGLIARAASHAVLWLGAWQGAAAWLFVPAAWSRADSPHNHQSPKSTMTTSSAMVSDPYRLPRHVIPTHYDLRIEPDLHSHSFTGHEVITLTVIEPTSEVLLNATELVTLCHLTENLFDKLRNGEMTITPILMDVILDATGIVRDADGGRSQRYSSVLWILVSAFGVTGLKMLPATALRPPNCSEMPSTACNGPPLGASKVLRRFSVTTLAPVGSAWLIARCRPVQQCPARRWPAGRA